MRCVPGMKELTTYYHMMCYSTDFDFDEEPVQRTTTGEY